MSPRGRKAALPDDGPKTSRGLLDGEETHIVVRCFDEQERTHKDYDFTGRPSPRSYGATWLRPSSGGPRPGRG
jgi:hypothetical protein